MAETEYIWRVHCLIPSGALDRAGRAAAEVLPGGDDESRMFGVPLRDQTAVADAADLYGCSTLLTEAQRTALIARFASAGVGARWVQMRADDGTVVASSRGVELGSGAWSWEATLSMEAAVEVRDG